MSTRRDFKRALALALLSLICSVTLGSAVTHATEIRISEIFTNPDGTDDGQTFIELVGPGGASLSGYTVEGVNGGTGTVYLTVDLSAFSIPLDGVFVAADTSGGVTSVPEADALFASLDPQNGPDSIRLVMGGVVIDAIGYGDFTSAVFAGEGNPVPLPPSGSSLARLFADVDTDDNLADFVFLETPTPGTAPLLNTVTVPEPASFLLLGAALLPLTARMRWQGIR
jgi:hypothetical protein